MTITSRFQVLLPILVLCVSSASVSAQVINERIDITITNVDVVVLSRDGKTVEGLTRDDFELRVDGKLQPVTNFYAEQRATSDTENTNGTTPENVARDPDINSGVEDAEGLPQHAFLYLDESAFGQPVTFPHLQRSIVAFSQRLARECARCRLAIYGRRAKDLVVLLPPTSDFASVAAILEGERQLQQGRATARRRMMEILRERDASMSSIVVRREARMQAAALGRLLAVTGSIEGRKVLAVMSNVPIGGSARLLRSEPNDSGGRPPDEYTIPAPRNPAEARARMPAWDDNKLVDDSETLSAIANATGVTIYPVISSGLAELENPVSAERSASRSLQLGAVSPRLSELHAGVQRIAEATGGRMQHATTNFDLPLTAMAEELQSYYSLGFRASEEARSQRIEVRLRNRRDVTVRARRTLTASTRAYWDASAASLGNGVERAGPVHIKIRVASIQNAGRTRIVSLVYMFDARRVMWQTDGTTEATDTELVLRATDLRGAHSELVTVPLKLRREAAHPISPFGDALQVRVGKGPQELFLLLRDKIANEVSWAMIEIP